MSLADAPCCRLSIIRIVCLSRRREPCVARNNDLLEYPRIQLATGVIPDNIEEHDSLSGCDCRLDAERGPYALALGENGNCLLGGCQWTASTSSRNNG